ncbi:hypothetical protein BGZ80_006389, partial [Entomortierella chlamydospora]
MKFSATIASLIVITVAVLTAEATPVELKKKSRKKCNIDCSGLTLDLINIGAKLFIRDRIGSAIALYRELYYDIGNDVHASRNVEFPEVLLFLLRVSSIAWNSSSYSSNKLHLLMGQLAQELGENAYHRSDDENEKVESDEEEEESEEEEEEESEEETNDGTQESEELPVPIGKLSLANLSQLDQQSGSGSRDNSNPGSDNDDEEDEENDS